LENADWAGSYLYRRGWQQNKTVLNYYSSFIINHVLPRCCW
jgi:hypothetical protein